MLQNPIIEEMVSIVNQDTLYKIVKRLQDFITRNSLHDSAAKACEYVFDKFVDYGYDYVYYSNSGEDPWGQGEFKGENVVAIKHGITDTAIIICAHLDATAGNPHSPEEIAPGADDNASGSAGVLMAAKAMADYSFKHEIRFICFMGEEQGLIGSGEYADSISNTGDILIGVYNMDMIGYNDGGVEDLDATADGHSGSAFLEDSIEHYASIYVPELVVVKGGTGPGTSDHASFQQVGYAAIICNEDRSVNNPYYHSEGDTIGTSVNDFLFMERTTKAIVATVAELAKVMEVNIKEKYKTEFINNKTLQSTQTLLILLKRAKNIKLFKPSGAKLKNKKSFKKGIYFLVIKNKKHKLLLIR